MELKATGIKRAKRKEEKRIQYDEKRIQKGKQKEVKENKRKQKRQEKRKVEEQKRREEKRREKEDRRKEIKQKHIEDVVTNSELNSEELNSNGVNQKIGISGYGEEEVWIVERSRKRNRPAPQTLEIEDDVGVFAKLRRQERNRTLSESSMPKDGAFSMSTVVKRFRPRSSSVALLSLDRTLR